MTEVQTELVSAAPRPPLRSLVAGYQGYHTRSAAGVHRGLPSRHLTFVVTIEGTVDLVGPTGSVRSFDRIVGGLRDVPVSIAHDGHQYGIQTDLTPPRCADPVRAARRRVGGHRRRPGDTARSPCGRVRRPGAYSDHLGAAVRPSRHGVRAARRVGTGVGARTRGWLGVAAARRIGGRAGGRSARGRGGLEPPAPAGVVPGGVRTDPEGRRPADAVLGDVQAS